MYHIGVAKKDITAFKLGVGMMGYGMYLNIVKGADTDLFARAVVIKDSASGKKVVIDGWAYADSISVADLRHYAEDAGDSKEEIEKITQPEAEYTFMARGVIIRK
jgi:hypothetical protein